MKRKTKKRLTLNRETIHNLTGVTGGGKEDPTLPLSGCFPTMCGGRACMPDSTPNNGCMPSVEVPCDPVSEYC